VQRDFSLEKYKQIILVFANKGFKSLSLFEALESIDLYSREKIFLIRHDIDTKYDLPIALKMAQFEAERGIIATYYFRTVPETLNLGIIRQIANLGHEIGYHYEVMAFEKGNENNAIARFKNDLELLRSVYPVKTICQHGGAMGIYNTTSLKGLFKIARDYFFGSLKIEYYVSIDLWRKYKFEDFGLIGDAYLSLDFKQIKYFSDTGQRWDGHETRILDKIDEGENAFITTRTSNELINLIESGKVPRINLLVHPANWNDNIFNWLKWGLLQKLRNLLKRIYKSKNKL